MTTAEEAHAAVRTLLGYIEGDEAVDREGLQETPKRVVESWSCLLYTSPSPRDGQISRMPSSA